MFKNILIKISGEALQGEKEDCDSLLKPYNDAVVDRITDELIELKNQGIKVSLVIGGGNYCRGRSSKEGLDRAKIDQIGMLATVMNAIYLSEILKVKGAKSAILTPFVVGTFTQPFEKDKAMEHLEQGDIVFFAGGSGLPFFSTDTITAIRAAEIQADAVFFAKPVSGIYDSDPKKNSSAIKYNKLTYAEFISKNLGAIDISAMSICSERNLKSVVFNLNVDRGIVTSVMGSEEELFRIGSLITN